MCRQPDEEQRGEGGGIGQRSTGSPEIGSCPGWARVLVELGLRLRPRPAVSLTHLLHAQSNLASCTSSQRNHQSRRECHTGEQSPAPRRSQRPAARRTSDSPKKRTDHGNNTSTASTRDPIGPTPFSLLDTSSGERGCNGSGRFPVVVSHPCGKAPAFVHRDAPAAVTMVQSSRRTPGGAGFTEKR